MGKSSLPTLIMLPALVLCLFFLFFVPRSAIQPVHIDIEQIPSDVGLSFEEFSIQPEDAALRLAGWWIPANDPSASLVFIHGGGSNRHSTFFNSVPFYKEMVTAGVNVTAIDLRNHGASDDHAAGVQFGVTEQYDALAAVRWTRQRAPDTPVFLMGISMGGATAIHAAASGAEVAGLILLDPLLDTRDVFARGGTVQTGLPSGLFLPSAWSAQQFFGLPRGTDQASEKAARLQLPILLMQDPADPVTRAVHSEALARANGNVQLWMAPPITDHPELPAREGWGTHVMAYVAHPKATVTTVVRFLKSVSESL